MSILQGTCDSFRQELLQGIHAFGTDTFKIALYNASTASLQPSTTVYSSTGEISPASGYTAGGQALAAVTVNLVPGIAFVTFSAPTWTMPSSTGVDGALIYNSSKANRAVAVLNFGTTRYPSSIGLFVLQTPYDPINNAIVRLA